MANKPPLFFSHFINGEIPLYHHKFLWPQPALEPLLLQVRNQLQSPSPLLSSAWCNETAGGWAVQDRMQHTMYQLLVHYVLNQYLIKHIYIYTYIHIYRWTSDWNWGLYKINLGLCWGSRFWLWGSPPLVIPRCCHGCLAWYFILWRWAGGEIVNPHENSSIVLISFPHDPMMDPTPCAGLQDDSGAGELHLLWRPLSAIGRTFG